MPPNREINMPDKGWKNLKNNGRKEYMRIIKAFLWVEIILMMTILLVPQSALVESRPVIESMEPLARETDEKYNTKWLMKWDSNGTEGPWKIETIYGGADAEDGFWDHSASLMANDEKETEQQINFLEPGVTYAFRLVSENGEGAASDWYEATVPVFQNSTDYFIQKIVIPSMTIKRIQAEETWPDGLEIELGGGSLFGLQKPMVFAVSPVGRPNCTVTSGAWVTMNRIDTDFVSLSLALIFERDFVDPQKGDYEFRVYINGQSVGDTMFSVK